MDMRKFLIASSLVLLPVAGALAADREERTSPDATSAAIAALEANLKNTTGLEVDEVRVTGAGVACINYRVTDQGAKVRGYAVVQGDEVLKSSSDDKRFEKAWSEHCLGPRGGMTSGE
ncbi:MAG TPA: hypothetical protein VGO61_20935 [Steroidobacteraceae bacterium]|jgi:hypothetical protein|nr:hypothetical protein [Steroidobacteraceae bacterium]